MNLFRGPLLKRIRAVAKSTVGDVLQFRDLLQKEGRGITPAAIYDKILDEWSTGGAEGARSRRSAAQQKALDQCLKSYEGLAYYLEMEGSRELGPQSPLRYWDFCKDVDTFVAEAGLPTQDKATKEAHFIALGIAEGPYKDHL